MTTHLGLIEISDELPMKEWAKKLMGERHNEAVTSLEAEKVEEETVFFVDTGKTKYLAFYVKGERLPADMSQPINQDHRKVMESIKIKKFDGELLYRLKKGGGENASNH